ncbi:MAG: fluoride efflux transporter CrcB [Pseudomonadales bacterium]
MSLMTILAIALGGAIGALGRFGLSNWFNSFIQIHHTVHIGTLLVNIIGSFLMGFLYVTIIERELLQPEWRSVLMVGMLGAFTTFSTFSIEAINFFERGHPWLALTYVVASVVFSLLAAGLAIHLARAI